MIQFHQATPQEEPYRLLNRGPGSTERRTMSYPSASKRDSHRITHLWASHWLLAIVLLFSAATFIEAQVPCPSTNPPFGTCFMQTGSYPGELPYAATVIDGESIVLVSDYLSGLFYKFDVGSLGNSSQFSCPLGPATYLGVAWDTDQDLLYWLVNDQGALILASSSSGGNLIGTPVVLDLPIGTTTVTGLEWHPGTGNLWTNDLQGDAYLELSPDGSFSGNSFSNPEATSPGAGAFGLGLSIMLDQNTGYYLFDIPVGPPSAQRANQVVRVDETGAEQGLFYPLASINALSGWVTGIGWTENGSWGGPSEFVVDLSNEIIVEVAVPNPNAPSISTFSCIADGDNNVTLEWINPINYSSIILSRDNVEIATIGTGIDTYTDADLDSGSYLYTLKPVPASGANLPEAPCSVVVGFGRLLGQVPHGGSNPGPTTVIESSGQLVVADSSGLTAWLYSKDLSPTGSIPGPFASAVDLIGIAWNSSNDTLTWLTSTGELLTTDLQGVSISSATLTSPGMGQLGEITWSSSAGRFLGIDRSEASTFEFDPDGTTGVRLMPIPPTPTGESVFIGGITSRDSGQTSVCDFAVGSINDGGISRIERAVDGTASGIGFDITPSANTGDVTGISSTETGPFGTPVTYLIGGDTATIYMLSGDLSGTGSDFIRGDLAPDGTRNLVDVTVLLINMFDPSQAPSTCLDAADINDDGAVDISDAISLLEFLFQGGSVPPAPSDGCGPDDSIDNLTCQEFEGC